MDRRLAALSVLILIAGCGGGGGGGSGPTVGNPNPNPNPGPTGGLDARPANASCVAPARTTSPATIALTDQFPGLANFQAAILGLQRPGDASEWYVVEQAGRVLRFDNDPQVTTAQEVLDIDGRVLSGGERGLLGMAFHPQFAANGRVYLSYTDNAGDSVIAQFVSSDGGATIDPGSETVVLRVGQDFSNHNGGHIAFGDDGFLYVALGDGGSGGDPNERAQDTTNLLGALLRLDVDSGSPYGIPPDNPFASQPLCPADHSSLTDCPEIYAWGLRNPWRFSFDRNGGALWLADVGQNQWEEVNIIELGGNYGWDCREGANDFEPAGCDPNLIDPVAQYDHSEGSSVTGGFVYRGSRVPGLVGDYLFADFNSGRIWALSSDGQGGYDRRELLNTNVNVSSFAEGADGELFVVDYSGRLLAVEAGSGGGGGGAPVAARLSDTGCVDSGNPSQPAPGLIPYEPRAAFWSDGADKERWLAVPDGQTVAIVDDDFDFPAGSVLMKHFRRGGTLIETRLFMRHPDGVWAGYTYEWNGAGTDADLVSGGKQVSVGGQPWIFPSEAQCLGCHTQVAGFSLGLEIPQLNGDLTYSETGRTANQLTTLDEIALFAAPLGDPAGLAQLTDPFDNAASLTDRARAYLHTNCSQCHRPNGPAPTNLDLRYDTTLGATNACDQSPQAGDLGIVNARLIAPGAADRSVLVARMDRRDADAMPPVGSALVDSAGVQLLSDWVDSLTGCN